MKYGFDELAVRSVYFASLWEHTNQANAVFTEALIKLNPIYAAIAATDEIAVRSYLASNTNMMVATFAADFARMGNVDDSKAAADSTLGRNIFRYCSKHFDDLYHIYKDTKDGLVQMENTASQE